MSTIETKAKMIFMADNALALRCKVAWADVVDAIHTRAKTARPKPLNFEVYHETEVSRMAFLGAVVAGKTAMAAKESALQRVKLGINRTPQERGEVVRAARKARLGEG